MKRSTAGQPEPAHSDPVIPDEKTIFRSIVENSANKICTLDRNYHYLYFNPGYTQFMAELYGAKIDTSSGPFDFVTGEDERALLLSSLEKSFGGQKEVIHGYYWNGQTDRYYCRTAFCPVTDERGGIVAVSINITDLTEQKKTEERTQLYRELVENSLDGLSITTRDGHTIELNPAICKILGYSREEFLSKERSEFFDRDDPRLMELVTNRERDGFVVTDLTLIAKDGKKVPVNLSSRLCFNQEGNCYIIDRITDISERVEAEAALRASEEKYARTFRDSPMPIFLSTVEDGQILEANDQVLELFGYRREEIIGRTSIELGMWVDAEARSRMVKLMKEQGSVRDFELEIKTRSGEIRQALGSFELTELSGKMTLVSQLHDITELKRGQEAQAFLALIVEASEDGIIGTSLDERIISWNSGAAKIYGYTPDEIQGQHISKIVPPDYRYLLPQILDDIRSGKSIMHQEVGGLRKDGVIIDILLSLSPVKDKDGKIIAIAAINQDITERKRIAAELASAHQRANEILESIGDAFFALDAEERFTYVNTIAENLWNLHREKLLGKRIWDVFPALLDTPGYEQIRRAISEQVAVSYETYHEGSKQWLASSVYPSRGGVSIYIRDITELKQAQTEAINQERFKILVELSPDAVCLADEESRIVSCNRAMETLTGLPRNQLIGNRATDLNLISPEQLDQIKEHFYTPYLGLEPLTLEIEVPQENQPDVTIEIRVQSVEIKGRLHLISTIRDISERKRLETELREALEKQRELALLKDRFISTTSHEFRTPLTVIQAASESLQKYIKDMSTEQIQNRVDKIKKQVGHIVSLLNDVLAYSRLQDTHLVFNRELGDLAAYCKDVIEELYELEEDNHRIVAIFPPGPVETFFNRGYIQKIVNNLLVNALKFSPASTEVRLELTVQQSTIKIRVTDQGVGIPEKELENIFEPFYRAENVATIQGTGLGLAIVREAVKLHGGSIGVESREGLGTTFTVELPLVTNIDG